MGRLRMRSPVLRAGLKYGLMSAVISFILTAFDIADTLTGTGTSLSLLEGLIVFLVLVPLVIYYLLTSALAGRAAARQTGSVGDGALAGVVTCVISTLVAAPGSAIQYIVLPNELHTAATLSPLHAFGMPDWVVLLVEEVIGLVISLAVYALLGALGGLAGRRAYRRRLSGHEAPAQRRTARRRRTREWATSLGLALVLLAVGSCMLLAMLKP